MIITRQETWGYIQYDTSKHIFNFTHIGEKEELPYISKPLVLNIDLTLKCNMACYHCVAQDMRDYYDKDLLINEEIIKNINQSPFMVLVITGGEPLLPEYESKLIQLINGIENKGLIIDTNGTITPSKKVIDLIYKKNVLVRISLDSIRVQDEISLRHFPGSKEKNEEIYHKKIELTSKLKSLGIDVAVQSVLHKINQTSIQQIPEKLKELLINKWYIQRLIPTKKIIGERRFFLQNIEYEKIVDKLENKCRFLDILCFTKKDRRHNCVFLLVGDGRIYTQSEKISIKLYLGEMRHITDYFQYVSASEHSMRYYDIPIEKIKGRIRNL